MKSALSAWIVAGTVVCVTPAFAQGQQQAGGSRQQQTQMQQGEAAHQGGTGQQARQRGMRKVQGTILKQKEVTVRGTDRRHQVVLLETQGGRRVVVDLGSPMRNAPQLKEGQQLQASGVAGRVGDRAVLFAQRATIGGKEVQLNRPEQRFNKSLARQVTGQVVRQKNVSVPGSDVDNTVVLLRTQQGIAAVDLGPADQLGSAQLKEGQRLSVRARPVILTDRIVLVADQLTSGGKTMRINRQQSPATGGAGVEPQDEQGR
ncbi:hypothetical protein JQX13_13150 [Archangium violaceum]|uniref:hypothetical protein n=1 Tax=Archangium violaceum TaxID=83451 RepID=UPI00193BA65C|nr:hypothetical protein [Archangium violaceum]QRK10929.1 hypothetical protein JQX13_13150 [Archangium violaceum]